MFEMMEKMGFHSTWIRWIKECLSTAAVSVLINGSPIEEFVMKGGLCQGDPLSPFLFLIVTEDLHLMLEKAKSENLFFGIQVGKSGLQISHVKYADVTILSAPTTQANILAVKSILRWFELLSGFKVNFRKSCLIVFHKSPNWCSLTATILKCSISKLPFKYLGVPVGGSPVDPSSGNRSSTSTTKN